MRRLALRLVAGLFAVALALGACGGSSLDSLTGILRDPAPDVGGVALADASNADAPFTLKAAPDELLVVYFGYTACPDVCPTTLADLRSAVRRLEDDASRVDVAIITVDPDRDDGERLTSYIQSFFPGGHALRSDDADELQAAADAFGAAYEVVQTDEGVEVGHTAYLYGVDESGLIRVQWSFGVTPDDLEHDLAYLLREGI
ncbi:MAG: SCO family protein [bacterium]|nr:SCO family protein [bacterium]